MFTLEGKTALITGGAGGIGAACADVFARHHIGRLALTDVRKDNLLAAAERIEGQTGLRCLCVDADIRKEEAVAALIRDAAKQMGRLDILVNCAGISRMGSLYEVSEQQWDLTFDINVKGLFFVCREAFKVMETQKCGVIINLASQAARGGGLVVTPDYPSSKAAVLTLTKSLARAGASRGIRVNSVSPGLIATEMTATYGYNPAAVPLGRIGTGEDVAGAVLFLASDYASYITGACIDVNGGIAMV
ncbi:MAG: SDR family oxidoreductase [Treponema sp.]|jgi:3-oxoacyl-[acyl-carrier protein] reductase|nr:SDR family oxidoreductase [Treponema sp.]